MSGRWWGCGDGGMGLDVQHRWPALAGCSSPNPPRKLPAHLPAQTDTPPLSPHPAASGEALFSAFGVFDGHGGRQVATFASNNLLKAVMAEVDASPIPLQVCTWQQQRAGIMPG